MPQLGFGIVLAALAVAVGLGALHALEPGHGKTMVAAYLVGSRGTAWHAMVLGLIVTATHTAGVYILGAFTLFASRYVVPERLYPWLGVISGLIIAVLGFSLLLRRYAGLGHAHAHAHGHSHAHAYGHAHHHTPGHGEEDGHAHSHHSHQHHPHPHPVPSTVSLRALLALGVTGGIVPCPAALVVLLSAVSLHRVGFGLLLIVAFSFGLAAVLIAIGLLMVYAHHLMARLQGDGRLITRWLPLTSAAVMTVFGMAIAVQALIVAGILQIRL
jgi:ABC-type nickel/cobalt efflux system permease component RcnA